MKPKIVILDGHTLNPGDLEWAPFHALGDVTLYPRTHGGLAERAANAEIVITNKCALQRGEIHALPLLRYIGVIATGTNVVDVDAARQRGIVVTNVPGYGTQSVAQHTMALLLELTNRVGEHSVAVRAGRWSECPDFSFSLSPLVELSGKTFAAVGLGAIGRRTAQMAAAFGMCVLTVRREGKAEIELPGVQLRYAPLDELFAVADVVSLHVPLTDETHHLVNAERLARMKPTALLLNTARGPLVDEAALAAALREGRVAGAGLDVLSLEPPVEGSPLFDCPQVVITPHNAWSTAEARGRLMQIAADNLAAFLAGKPQNVVGA